MNIDTTLGITGTVLGIIGVISGYIFYRLGLRFKETKWYIISTNLIQDNISLLSGLEVIYRGKKIPSITVSKIVFWNNGKETINNSDLLEINPLRIVAEEKIKILSAEVIDSNNESNNIKVHFDNKNNCAQIKFEYLDNKHGALIQVVHTGLSNSSLNIIGDIKGIKSITQYDPKKSFRWIYLLMLSFMLLIATVGVINFIPSKYINLAGIITGILFSTFIDKIRDMSKSILRKTSSVPDVFSKLIDW